MWSETALTPYPLTLHRLTAIEMGDGAVFEHSAVRVPEARKYGDFAHLDAVAKRYNVKGKL